jgi:surface polysaccharide O-acyltransferase-like enzyme
MERNGAFDRFRGIGAVCVVLIHAPPFYHSGIPTLQRTGWAMLVLCQTAVPFFFLLSGWMMGDKWARGRRTWGELSKSVSRLFLLYVPWFAFFLGLDAVAGLPHGWIAVARRFAGFADSRLDTRGYHLWFLPSLILAQIVCWSVLRYRRSIWPALAAGAFLYGLCAWMDVRSLALPWGLGLSEGIDLSLLCVSLGIWMGSRAAKTPAALPTVVLLAAVPLLFLEALGLDRISGRGMSIPSFQIDRALLPALLLAWLATRPAAFGAGWIGRGLDFLGKHSTGIYLAHLAFLTLLPFQRWVPDGFVRDNLVRWPVALAGSIALSMLLKRCPWEPVRRLVA